MSDQDKDYVIWSTRHRGWWTHQWHAYTRIFADAKLFTRDEAFKACSALNPDLVRTNELNELPIPVRDAETLCAQARECWGVASDG